MLLHKKLKRLVSVLCAVVIVFSFCGVMAESAAANKVTASTDSSVRQGDMAYCYVYVDSLESLAALEVNVHYDPTKLAIHSAYNTADCMLYDEVINPSDISFSYLFNGESEEHNVMLFYFVYEVLGDADTGSTYFDITIGEAYDNSINEVDISGSRCSFTITEAVMNKECYLYGDVDEYISSAVNEEFSISYYFDICEIASGSAVISYDPELFEVLEVIGGGLLDEKIVDINTSLTGAVYVSFVGTEYNYYSDLLTIRFKTLKNVSAYSQIECVVSDLCDLDLNPIACIGYTATVTVNYDSSYVEDAPKMFVSAEYDAASRQVIAKIFLEEESNLGAGDFTLEFDPDALKLATVKKGFTPSYFLVNGKKADEGILKFSIVSLTDITTAKTVLELKFDALENCTDKEVELALSGSMIANSLTEAIQLNIKGTSLTVPATHKFDEINRDATHHWGACQCGAAEDKVEHDFAEGKCSCGNIKATGSCEELDEFTVEGQVVTVANDTACKVVYWDAETGKFVALDASENVDGSYDFTAADDTTEVIVVVVGDVDGDGRLTESDKEALSKALIPNASSTLTSEQLIAADVNGNGKINSADRTLIARALLDENDALYKPLEW